jgi:hypothetical protein
MTEAAESLNTVAQIYSKGKITMQRRKNKKIRHKNEILKANEPVPFK